MPVIAIPLDQITDRKSFHEVFAKTLGFPKFYGRNMDAWIDCMSDPDFNSGLRAALATPSDVLTLSFSNVAEFRRGAPTCGRRSWTAQHSSTTAALRQANDQCWFSFTDPEFQIVLRNRTVPRDTEPDYFAERPPSRAA